MSICKLSLLARLEQTQRQSCSDVYYSLFLELLFSERLFACSIDFFTDSKFILFIEVFFTTRHYSYSFVRLFIRVRAANSASWTEQLHREVLIKPADGVIIEPHQARGASWRLITHIETQ